MKIENGINPNCSESVIRLYNVDFNSLPPDIMSNAWSNNEPTEGYSSMRPLPGTTCIYYYQMSVNSELMEWLESKKIPYDVEAPFSEHHPDWIKIDKTEEESELNRDGGGGNYYRRKPYAN